jgi:DNA-binding CsgD family transcriptional regulator
MGIKAHIIYSRVKTLKLQKPVMPKHWNIHHERRVEAAQMYSDGIGPSRIAEHFGVSPQAVNKMLRRMGVPRKIRKLYD